MAERRYLLDTNILSDLVKHPRGVAAEHVATAGEDAVCTSIVVACELRYGAAKKGSPALSGRVDELLSAIEILPLDEGVDAQYAEIRAAIEKAGTPIGANDYLIAAHGLILGLVLVTDNVGEFSRVPGLVVENWLVA